MSSASDQGSTGASRVLLAGVLALIGVLVGLLLPDRTAGPVGMMGMASTHYMTLLGMHQPWNLLLFMALPVVLAETLAITELAILYGSAPGWVHRLSQVAGVVVGPVMVAILVHLTRYVVVPLTVDGGWRGPADLIAVWSYLASGLPMVGITLVTLGVIGDDERRARKVHSLCVGVFLVLAHVAMILGMLDPTVLGWDPTARLSSG